MLCCDARKTSRWNQFVEHGEVGRREEKEERRIEFFGVQLRILLVGGEVEFVTEKKRRRWRECRNFSMWSRSRLIKGTSGEEISFRLAC